MNNIRLGRLGDNDKRYGPLTVSRKNKSDRKDSFFSYFYLETVTSEDLIYTEPLKDQFCNTLTFHFSPIGSIRLRLPFNILKPRFNKVGVKSWSKETIERLGRDWYYDVQETRTGFNFSGHGFQFNLPKRKTVVKDWPWTIDHKATTYYHSDTGEIHVTDKKYCVSSDVTHSNYLIRDSDGTVLVVSCCLVNRSYYRTKGILKWLRPFLPLKYFWSTEFQFSEETGAGKHSWKGGTVGSGINTTPDEPMVESLYRYCSGHGMVILGHLGHSSGPIKKKDICRVVQERLPVYRNLLGKSTKTKEV